MVNQQLVAPRAVVPSRLIGRSLFPALNQGRGFILSYRRRRADSPGCLRRNQRSSAALQRSAAAAARAWRWTRRLRVRERGRPHQRARDPNEVAFGMNATSFLRLLSLAIGRSSTRNEIVVTELDHEANIATWLQLERRRQDRLVEDARRQQLTWEDLASPHPKTRLVACTVTSHALGSIVDASTVAARARRRCRGRSSIAFTILLYAFIDVQASRVTATTSSAPAI